MATNWQKLKNALLWAWQLPQNLLGLLMFWWYSRDTDYGEEKFRGVKVLYSEKMRGGISLGEYVIVPFRLFLSSVPAESLDTIVHEWGHTRQSLRLGWLYLPVVGLPSLLWAWAHSSLRRLETVSYYRFWTERWADRLGGVKGRP